MELKHKLKIFQKLIVFLLIITMCLSFNIVKVNAWFIDVSLLYNENSPWGSENPFERGQCTWYTWGRVKQKLGISFPCGGDAYTWATCAANAGYTVDYTPSVDSIVVWPPNPNYCDSYGCYGKGHVAYLELLEGNTMYVGEGNWAGVLYSETPYGISIYEERHFGRPQFIHLTKQEEEVYKPKGSVQNLGNDFIATINVKKTPSLLLKADGKTNGSKVILSSLSETNTSVMWNFIRKSDGTYSIKNIDSGLSIDVFGAGDVNGEAVQLWKQENGDKNNWFIYDYNGAYRFVPRSSKNDMRAIDIPSNDIKNGQVLQLWDAQNDSNTAQTFLIRKFANSISLNNTSLTLEKGQTTTLKATYSPSDTYYKTLTWKSDNSSVVSVNEDGKITANKNGSAVITATTNNGKTAKCTITVKSKYLKGDLNYNNTIELEDVMEALKIVTEQKRASTSDIEVGDFDSNGKVDTQDAFQILYIYVNNK